MKTENASRGDAAAGAGETPGHSPRERPILFSGAMVLAILAGTKTQTRRRMKQAEVTAAITRGLMGGTGPAFAACPYGERGARLWVRETWAPSFAWDDAAGGKGYVYRATNDGPDPARWRPSIFMPRAASRLTLEVVEIRVQRLQEISEEDARAEGMNALPPSMTTVQDAGRKWFAALWDSINSKRPGCAWADNPWVWCVSFKREVERGQGRK